MALHPAKMATNEEIEMCSVSQEPGSTRGPENARQSAPSGRYQNTVKRLNDAVAKSVVGYLFRLDGSGHPKQIEGTAFSTELRAGLTTFATMAYIIAVNSAILAVTGYGCHCKMPLDQNGKCGNDTEWTKCYEEVRLDLITASAALAGLSSILFGLFTNLPVCLGPGVGLNAYFAYQVVGVKGTGPVDYRIALTAVFIEGCIFLFLALTGLRHWLVKIIPICIKIASAAGIGLFLILVGMSYQSGLGLVTGATAAPLTISGCPEHLRNEAGICASGIMSDPKMWLGIVFGGLLTGLLLIFHVKAAILIGIAIVSIMSWPRGTSFTYFPYTAEGDNRFNFFRKVVYFHPIKHTLAQQQWDLSGGNGQHFALALFTFLYVDIIDATATLYTMARFCSRSHKGERDFPRSTVAFSVDAVCISIGSLFGCSPVTTFVESAAGIAEGGRTGLTAVTTGVCFLIAMFFAPIFASIPPWATGGTLILVGCMMIRQISQLNWSYVGDAIPSMVTLTFIPFSFSVAYGIIAGLFTYVTINGAIWLIMKLSRGKIAPPDYDRKEYWSWKLAKGNKPWIFQVIQRLIYSIKTRREGSQRNRNPSIPLSSGDEASEHAHDVHNDHNGISRDEPHTLEKTGSGGSFGQFIRDRH